MSTQLPLMLAGLILAVILARAVAGEGESAAPTTAPAPAASAEDGDTLRTLGKPQVIRVGGNMEAQVERRGESYYHGTAAVTTPLPEGYPPPTPPGSIEIKDYPLVRRAMVTSTGNVSRGMNGGFWPLFRHIQSRDIEMTSPVEMDYVGLTAEEGSRPDSWTMSFLYRKVEQGPTGEDGKRVVVADLQPMTVAAIAYQGGYSLPLVREHLRRLSLWLEQNEETWERVGEPRAMFYNGPEQPDSRKWAEVQVPVRRRMPGPETNAASVDDAPADEQVKPEGLKTPPGTGGPCTPVPQD